MNATNTNVTLAQSAQSPSEMLAIIEKLKAQLAAAKAQPVRSLSLKVSAKGAVSLYGMGRFPVTLYGEQWVKVLDASDTIRAFIDANQSLLSVKGAAADADA